MPQVRHPLGADITRMLLTIEKLEKDQSKKETSVG